MRKVDPMINCHLALNHDALIAQVALANRISNDIDRGIDLTERISAGFKPDQSVSYEVLDYIRDYEDVCQMMNGDAIKFDVSIESAWDVVKHIVQEMWRFLCKLWEMIRSGFRYVFNSQYRASSAFVKYRQMLTLAGSSEDAKNKFRLIEIEGSITPDELTKLVDSTSSVVEMLEKLPDQASAEGIDNYISSSVAACGIVFKDNKFTDTFADIPLKAGTYGSLGWDIDTANKICGECVTCLGRIVKLKKLEGTLNTDVTDLRRKLSNQVAAGDDDSSLADVQQKLCFKNKMFKVVQAGLSVLSSRTFAMDTIMREIAEDADAVANGTLEVEDD